MDYLFYGGWILSIILVIIWGFINIYKKNKTNITIIPNLLFISIFLGWFVVWFLIIVWFLVYIQNKNSYEKI